MRILALDLGKYKTVACEYEAESGRHRFATVLTTPKALHDLIVDREPQRVVIEICSIACREPRKIVAALMTILQKRFAIFANRSSFVQCARSRRTAL
jgi:hypothetical protein